MSLPRLVLATALSALLGATACSADPDSAVADDDITGGSCRISPTGAAVDSAAASGPSTLGGALSTRDNRVVAGPFVGGRAIGEALADLVAGAQREVVVEFFDIQVGSWLAKRLEAAIAQLPPSVHVFVLVNPDQARVLGFLPEKPEDGVERLRAHFGAHAGGPRVTVSVWKHAEGLRMLEVMHTKLVVVDGARALLTDTNLQKNSDPVETGGKGWHQLGMIVEGGIAARLRDEVVDASRRATASLDAAPDLGTEDTAPRGCVPMTVVARAEGERPDASANRAYGALFRSARRRVRAITPNLNDDGALAALADATENAEVHLVLSKGFNDRAESLPGQGGDNERNVGRLAAMAKNKCKLRIRWFAAEKEPGVAVEGNVADASHAKWASADGATLILGSQNLDTQSWKKSRELGVAIDDANATRAVDEVFDAVWERSPVAYDGCP